MLVDVKTNAVCSIDIDEKEAFRILCKMCHDESWVRGLLSPIACKPAKSREEAIEFIESYKQGRISDDIIDKV